MQHDLGQTLARRRRSLVSRSIGGHFANETAEIICGDEYEQRFNDACGDASDLSDNENEVLSMLRKTGKVMKAIGAVMDLNSITLCLPIENTVHFNDGLDCCTMNFIG